MKIFGDALIITNVVIGVIFCALEVKCILHYKNTDGRCWRRVLFILIGAYWVGIYGFMLIMGERLDPALIQIFVRPGITISLAALASGSIIRCKQT